MLSPLLVSTVMNPHRPLPFVVHVDDCDGPTDVLDALLLERFVSGVHPHARTLKLPSVKAGADLVPAGATSVRTAVDTWRTVTLAEGPGWDYRAQRVNDASAVLTATGTDGRALEALLHQVSRDSVADDDDLTLLPVSFWHHGRHGPRRSVRSLHAPTWREARANYSAEVVDEVDRLMAVDPAALSGGLVLLHGPPGTGKTNLVRSLGQAWRSWCSLECVLDPERLLGDSSYLTAVLLGDEEEDAREPWRLLVLEDCDEVLAPDARKGVGQALSRLLNLADGLLGQGRQLLLCLTSNEDVSSFHPALVRPGRCVANVHVGALSAAEASAWSGLATSDWPDGATLAELYAVKQGERTPSRARRRPLGFRPLSDERLRAPRSDGHVDADQGGGRTGR